MKKIIALMMGLTVSAYGAMIQEGTQELGLSGWLDFETIDGTEVNFDASYGYFIMDGIQVGARASVYDSDSVSEYGLAAFAEYNLDLGSQLVPFVGVSVGWGKAEVDFGGDLGKVDDDAVVASAQVGAKYFFVENIAVSLAYQFDWASEDLYYNDNKAEDTDHSIQLGMRFYF